MPAELTVRIIRYAEHQVMVRKSGVPEADVKLLLLLSNPLKMELVRHNYGPLVAKHPFFRRCAEADPEAMRDVCFAAISCLSLSVGDTLFTEASSDDRMIFVLKGQLVYARAVGGTASCASVIEGPRRSSRRLSLDSTSSSQLSVAMSRRASGAVRRRFGRSGPTWAPCMQRQMQRS